MRIFLQLTAVFLFAILLVTTTGCASTADRRDSDIPWNQPQPWEGSPYIPGMNRY
jgi:hypothetical protein